MPDWLDDDGADDPLDFDFDPSPLDPMAGQRQLAALMARIRLARPVTRSLFTFGHSVIPYYLVFEPGRDGQSVMQFGEVKVSKPTILTPSRDPEFFGLFEQLAEESGADLADYVQFALQRTAAFDRLKVENEFSQPTKPGGGVEEVLDRINARLDDEEDEDTSVLVCPRGLGPLAVLKLTGDRIQRSAADNVQELRERGFLPD